MTLDPDLQTEAKWDRETMCSGSEASRLLFTRKLLCGKAVVRLGTDPRGNQRGANRPPDEVPQYLEGVSSKVERVAQLSSIPTSPAQSDKN